MEILYTVDGEIRVVTFDATILENHSTTATATEHPVAAGVDITDHVRAERDTLSVEVHVSNTPIFSPNVDGANGSVRQLEISSTRKQFSRLAQVKRSGEVENATLEDSTQTRQANVLQFSGSFDRVVSVYEVLTALAKAGQDVTVTTSLRQYDSMVILTVGTPREAGSRNAVKFTMDLAEIRFAETETVDTPEPLETRAERARRRGAQGAEETEEEERSMAAALVEDVAGQGLITTNRPNGNSLFR